MQQAYRKSRFLSYMRQSPYGSYADLRAVARGGQEGLSLIEALIAMGVLAVAAMMPLGTMATASRVDSEVQQRSVALRAALARMDAVLAFDYGNDLQTFVDYWTDPQNANFGIAEFDEIGDDGQNATGTVALDVADPLRVGITVTVNWVHQGQPRSLLLPGMMTEVTNQ